MAILEREVWVGLNHMNISYYENKGYKIERSLDKRGRIVIPRGKNKILIKTNDLQNKSNIKVTRICDGCGKVEPNQIYSNLMEFRRKEHGEDRCYRCTRIKAGETRKRNAPYELSLEYYALTNQKEYLLNEYSTKNIRKPKDICKGTKAICLWNCFDCGSEYEMSLAYKTNRDSGCPFCSGHRINHTNCLAKTHPDISKLLVIKTQAYKISYGSNKKLEFKCSKCNHIENKAVNVVTSRGFSCSMCSDGMSYPEKFIVSLLNQINAIYEKEKKFNWSKRKRYDFYLPGTNTLLEAHGSQHYIEKGFKVLGGRSLKEERNNDRLKKRLALKNGICNYIVLDCRESTLEHIKKSVLSSQLSELYGLDTIDWYKCHSFALCSLVEEACKLWNDGVKETKEIGKKLNISSGTVVRYLKQGAELKWCNYDPQKHNRKQVIQLTENNELIKVWGSGTEAAKILNLSQAWVATACRYKKNAYGYKWMYKEDYDRNGIDQSVVLIPSKKVVQFNKNGELIKVWDNGYLASKSVGTSRSGIYKVCKGKGKTAGGYKWMYKEDYDKYIEEKDKEYISKI